MFARYIITKEIGLLCSVVGFAGISVWLATANEIFQRFAPWSYFAAATIAVLAALCGLNLFYSVIIKHGWKPEPKWGLLSKERDAPLKDVASYILNKSKSGIKISRLPRNQWNEEIQELILDAVDANYLKVWVRAGGKASQSIPHDVWRDVEINLEKGYIMVEWDYGVSRYTPYLDVKFNWREVYKAWPEKPLWKKICRKQLNLTSS